MAPADPELDDGADDEPNEPLLDDEPELDDDPELDDEPELDEPEPELVPLPEDPVLADPVPDDPVPELAECPVPAEFDDPVLLAVLCAAAGSSTITTPATATPTIPAPMVALRRRRRAWSRAKMADTVRSSLFILGLLYGGQYPISVGAADLTVLGSSSPVALSLAAPVLRHWRGRLLAGREHPGQLGG